MASFPATSTIYRSYPLSSQMARVQMAELTTAALGNPGLEPSHHTIPMKRTRSSTRAIEDSSMTVRTHEFVGEGSAPATACPCRRTSGVESAVHIGFPVEFLHFVE